MRKRAVIVGGGQAGFQVAAALRQKRFGDDIVLLSGESEPPHERPPLSKAFLKGETDRNRLFFRPPSFYQDRDIELRLATWVEEIDAQAARLRIHGKGEIPYDWLVLATGAKMRRLKLPGAELPGIHYLRTIADSLCLRESLGPGRRLCVIGGGYIGLEVAVAARTLGAEVTVLEAQDRVMTRTASEPIARALATRHAAAGVEIRTGVTVERFLERDGRARGVALAGGEMVAADRILVGIGVMPETSLAEAAGLDSAGGIRVDALGESSVEGVFAAGDCASYAHPLALGPMVFESVQNAVDQANAVASALLGAPKPYEAVPWFWSDQYELKLQTAGLPMTGDRQVVRGQSENGAISVAHLREGRLVALESLGRMKDFVQARKLIAAGAKPDPERLADPDVPLKAL